MAPPARLNVPTGLHKRRRKYYIRIRVPHDLTDHYGKAYVVESLQTADRAEAERRALKRSLQLLDEFDSVRDKLLATPPPATKAEALLRAIQDAVADSRAGKVNQQALETLHDLLVDHAHDLDDAGQLKADQRDAARALLASMQDETNTPLSVVIKEYLQEIEHRVTPATLAAKARHLRALTDWLPDDPAVGQLSRRQAGAYVSQRVALVSAGDRARKSVRDELTDIGTFWRWAIARGYSELNPWEHQTARLKAPTRGGSEQHSRRPWTTTEMVTFLKGTKGPEMLRAVFAIAAYSGMRSSEIASLRASDAAEGVFRIRHGKTKAAVRQIPIHPAIQPIVDQLRTSSTDGWLLPGLSTLDRDSTKRGQRLSRLMSAHLRKTLKMPEVELHGLRHTFATACERAGIPESTIRQLIGHARPGITLGLYSHGIDLPALQQAIESISYGSQVEKELQGPCR